MTIIEVTTKFEVSPADEPGVYTWHEAMAHAEKIGDGWRAPTKEELNLIYERRAEIPGLNLTGSDPAGWYWSGKTCPGWDDGAWDQRFSDGYQGWHDKGCQSSLRLVRSNDPWPRRRISLRFLLR